MDNHQWTNIIRKGKGFRRCCKCKKEEKAFFGPRLRFTSDSCFGHMRLDFWTPPKEKRKITVSSIVQYPKPSHFVAWQYNKANRRRVLCRWINNHLKKIKKKAKVVVVVKRKEPRIKDAFIIKSDNMIEDNYIKIIRVPVKNNDET